MRDLIDQVHQVSGRYQDKIEALISPLASIYGVNAHAYYRIDSQGFVTYISNLPEIAEYYFEHQLYKNNPFLKHPSLVQSGFMLACSVEHSDFQHGQQCIEQKYQLNNQLLIFEKEGDILHAHGFATTHQNQNLTNIYLNNLKQFQLYCDYFRQETEYLQNKLKDHKANFGLFIGHQFTAIDTKPDERLNEKTKEKFFHWLNSKCGDLTLYKPLSPREIECLVLLHNGNPASRVAQLLSIQKRTVEHHIENIKAKLNCFNKLEVLSFVSELKRCGGDISFLQHPWD